MLTKKILRQEDAQYTLGMRNSTGSPLFSDFKSDHSRVVRFRLLVKGNEDPGYEGVAGVARPAAHAPSVKPRKKDNVA